MLARNLVLGLVAWLYALGMQMRLWAYKCGILAINRVKVPVICVGNITMGGSGKTPVVAEIVRQLQNKGKKVVVISRGYGRRKEEEIRIVSDGKTVALDFDEGGDEPVMLARSCKGAVVMVGGNRYAAATVAIERFEPDVIVLDDGFQHLGLWRDIDLLVFDGTQGVEGLKVFPAGTLREPLRGMRRATAAIVTKLNLSGDAQDVPGEVRAMAPDMKVFRSWLEPVSFAGIDGEEVKAGVSALTGCRVITVCGIGNPATFERLVSGTLGMSILKQFVFRDHHRYTESDIDAIERSRERLGAEWVLTTEKDAVKIRKVAQEANVWRAIRVEVRLQPEDSDEFDAMLTSLFDKQSSIDC